ncbi:MAG: trimeric intracellular cation channel family protein [Ruminococcaceae bacterium]|nr:trimeric intracellular cation channel family protein [Oscillospiraceae bacterium]
MNDTVIVIMEWIGTVAFAVSGALIALARGLDLFGVIFVGCITSVGGGILRDVLMGQVPPSIFSNPLVLALAALTSLLVFIVSYLKRKSFGDFKKRLEIVNNYFDAVGLAVFTVIGVEKTFAAGFSGRFVFAVCMGMLTGVGGGLLRDILVDQTPSVLKKHVYAVASLAGACVYYAAERCFDKTVSVLVSVTIIILIRLLATKFRWRLPRIDFDQG